MKEQVIQIPDNLEIKEIKDGKIILVEKENKLTYEDIAKELFSEGDIYFTSTSGNIGKVPYKDVIGINDANNAKSKKQLEKLLAINKLMNVAKYLNGDWKVDWKCDDIKGYYIYYSYKYNKLIIIDNESMQELNIYFKSEELAQQAIEILGEETIKLALCTDY